MSWLLVFSACGLVGDGVRCYSQNSKDFYPSEVVCENQGAIVVDIVAKRMERDKVSPLLLRYSCLVVPVSL